jgi:hypothetical protein
VSRYLSLERFTELTIMPSPDVSALEALESGWIQRQIDRVGAAINARLIKRYAVPFGDDPAGGAAVRANCPLIIEDWIVAIVTLRAYGKRGFNPSSEMDQIAIVQPAKDAEAQIAEAAKSDSGLFELPLRSTSTDGGVTKTGVLSYTERSPYVFTDEQQETGREEDRNGEGTFS